MIPGSAITNEQSTDPETATINIRRVATGRAVGRTTIAESTARSINDNAAPKGKYKHNGGFMDELTVDDLIRCHSRREDGAARRWTVALKLVLSFSLVVVCQCALAQATYRIQPLGFRGGCTTSYAPEAAGFNEADQVTGAACNANGAYHAFLWKNDGTPIVDLGPPETRSSSYAVAINASGVVAGAASDSTALRFAFEASGEGTPMTRIYDGFGGDYAAAYAMNNLGQLTGEADPVDLASYAFFWKNDGSPMLKLGSLGGNYSYGEAINASGQIAGSSFLPGDTVAHAVLWKNDGSPILDLGTLGGDNSDAFFINVSGQVAGTSDTRHSGSQHVYFWGNDGRPIQDLGTLGGPSSSLSALNDAGQVVGSADLPGKGVNHAFVWKNDGSPMQDLGTFGGNQSGANGINSSGQVTGIANFAGNAQHHAFLWSNDGTPIKDLNKLIDPTDPLKPYITLVNGLFINDRSDIVAGGTNSRTGEYGLYLLQSGGITGSALTVAPLSLAFGNQPINTSSAAQSVTVTNTSSKAVAITGIALRGTAPKQFAFTDDCGKSLAAHTACTIKVTFKPTTEGAKTAFLDVNGGGGGLRSVKLTGTGTGTNPWLGHWDGRVKSTCGYITGPFDIVIVSVGQNKLSLSDNYGDRYGLKISSTDPNFATSPGDIVRYTLNGNSLTGREPNSCQTARLTRVQ